MARNLQWNLDASGHAGTEVTFTVRLEDEGVKHDLEVYGDGVERVKIAARAGPATQTLRSPSRTRLLLVCTIHAQMEGDIFAEQPAR